MDFYLDATDSAVAGELRRELSRYFRRHAVAGSDFDGAELAVSELITNAVRHAPGPAWVHVDWAERCPRLEIHDLGPGFALRAVLPDDSDPLGSRGLFLVSHVAGELSATAKRAGGSRVSAVMPVERLVEENHDPPRQRRDALPSPEEADEDGTFGREPFLRALVVQLAQAVEMQAGPDAVEAAVAQVGSDVGGRMEDEYRRAREIVGGLDHKQIADLYVRLKAAIGGDFYVVECDAEKIVLGNRACPFGDVVKRAPGLCRMTSSVFGGIAARNTGGATVVLEERIAVGDPECRVVVWLGGDKRGRWQAAHDYAGTQRPAPR
ncbi:MAG TPA: methanogen output domain 1-containing protein [Solirubrobacteraceae bacterium]|nr:methanogen output domain 1-containing protein [Solirubrobacteraceae bacterium]